MMISCQLIFSFKYVYSRIIEHIRNSLKIGDNQTVCHVGIELVSWAQLSLYANL